MIILQSANPFTDQIVFSRTWCPVAGLAGTWNIVASRDPVGRTSTPRCRRGMPWCGGRHVFRCGRNEGTGKKVGENLFTEIDANYWTFAVFLIFLIVLKGYYKHVCGGFLKLGTPRNNIHCFSIGTLSFVWNCFLYINVIISNVNLIWLWSKMFEHRSYLYWTVITVPVYLLYMWWNWNYRACLGNLLHVFLNVK